MNEVRNSDSLALSVRIEGFGQCRESDREPDVASCMEIAAPKPGHSC